jgi:ribosomal protein S18 acetylase RimI-like enzyme
MPTTHRELEKAELKQAARVIGRGMNNNPLHIRIFGDDPTKRRRRITRFYSRILPMIRRKGRVMGAFDGSEMIGVVGISEPGRCQPHLLDMIRILPLLMLENPPRLLLRIRSWVKQWSNHDLDEKHWHLGPAAVLPKLQRQGIGSGFLESLSKWLDDQDAPAYLETEREGNVRLYERFGFKVINQADVMGVPCWFMKREPKGGERIEA